MIGIWLVLVALTLCLPLTIFLGWAFASRGMWYAGGGLLIVGWLAAIAIALYRMYVDHYELTSQRLKHRHGILFRHNDRIELIDIDDVMYRQGPVQTALGLGTIEITSSDTSHPQFLVSGIDDVRKVADLIDDARRAERRKRGLHIEAI